MIVVSDTSPLTALLTVGQVDLVARLFRDVVIPEAVCKELLKSHTPLPAWLRVQAVQNRLQADLYAQSVDLDEAEAIALALELRADHLLIDERKGRRLAAQQGLSVVGLLGVVLLAKRHNLIPQLGRC
jgi:hypothetical protein